MTSIFSRATAIPTRGQFMIFKMKVLFTIASLLLLVGPSAAEDFTYQEYTKAPDLWKRGFVFGIARYMSAVAQPDEEAPYPVRAAFQRCLAAQRIHFLSGRSRHMSQPILLAPKGQWLRSSSRRCLICAGRKSKRRNRPSGRQAKDEPMRRALISLSVAARFGRHGLS